MSESVRKIVDRLVEVGSDPKASGGHWYAKCPAHDDGSPSLSVGEADRFVGAVVKCHTGCHLDDVLAALDLTSRDLFDEDRDKARGSVEVARYDYCDLMGTVVFTKVRYFPKDFRVMPAGVVGKMAEVPLYRLPEVSHAIAHRVPVYVVEGEKDADRLASLGYTATTNYAGAAKADQRAKWRDEYAAQLSGADVVIVADNDEPGRAHARHWRDRLTPRCRSVLLVVPARGKDVSDLLDMGGTLDELVDLDQAPEPVADEEELADATADHDAFEEMVRADIMRTKAREEARRRLAAERAAAEPPMDVGTLGEVLSRPETPPDRVQGLIPSDGSTLITAQRKTGKTTFVLNLGRSLLTGEEFLGRFPVIPITGTVALLNFEVSAATMARWADEVGIDHDRLTLVNLRGRRNPFVTDEDRAELARMLRARSTEVVIVDTFARAFTGKSQNDVGEVIPFLVGLDEFVRTDVGASDLILTTHAGWNGERTRGSTGLEDWPDSIIRLTRDPEDESQRFMSAMGRDVEVDEDRLNFHAPTRRLTLAGVGSRKELRDDRKTAELAVFVVRIVNAQPGVSTSGIEKTLKATDDAPTFRSGDVAKAAEYAEARGRIRVLRNGPGKATQHFPGDPNLSPGEVENGLSEASDLSQPLPLP